jgi:hypothetical protein
MKRYNYNAQPLEGDLYECPTEDGIGITFDCLVTADVSHGGKLTTYTHKTFLARGAGTYRDEHGQETPCIKQSRAEAQAFADAVNAVGVIDLDEWEETSGPDSTLEERLAVYAAQEQAERNAERFRH